MIALASFLGFLAMVFVASLLGRHLRRQRRQQTRPVAVYVVRDEQLDITPAIKRGRL